MFRLPFFADAEYNQNVCGSDGDVKSKETSAGELAVTYTESAKEFPNIRTFTLYTIAAKGNGKSNVYLFLQTNELETVLMKYDHYDFFFQFYFRIEVFGFA